MELLLDTVSNVFGGVMFLTLLAALLVISRGGEALQPTNKSPSATTDGSLDDPTSMPGLENENVEIEIANGVLIGLIAPGQSYEDIVGTIATIEQKSKEIEDKKAILAGIESEIASNDAFASQQRNEDERQAKRLAELNASLGSQKQVIDQSEAKATRVVQFSLLRNASTSEATIFLRYGKFYIEHKHPSDDAVNPEDIEVYSIGSLFSGKKAFRPRKSGGQTCTPESLQSLVDHFEKNFPSRRYHITIAVWDDSFAEFNHVKNALVKAGYEYRTIPCTDISEIVQGGGDSLVQ